MLMLETRDAPTKIHCQCQHQNVPRGRALHMHTVTGAGPAVSVWHGEQRQPPWLQLQLWQRPQTTLLSAELLSQTWP